VSAGGDQGQPQASADGLQNRAVAQPRDFFAHRPLHSARGEWSADAMTAVLLK